MIVSFSPRGAVWPGTIGLQASRDRGHANRRKAWRAITATRALGRADDHQRPLSALLETLRLPTVIWVGPLLSPLELASASNELQEPPGRVRQGGAPYLKEGVANPYAPAEPAGIPKQLTTGQIEELLRRNGHIRPVDFDP